MSHNPHKISELPTNIKTTIFSNKKWMNFADCGKMFSNKCREENSTIWLSILTNNSVFSGWIQANMKWSTNKMIKFELKQMHMHEFLWEFDNFLLHFIFLHIHPINTELVYIYIYIYIYIRPGKKTHFWISIRLG